MTTLDVRPGGPALDLTTSREAALLGEVARLRAELHQLHVAVDDLLDRESMYAGAPCMERLTTSASMDRLGAARARHIRADVEATGVSTGVFA
ncbi:hypothetical protein [Nocardia sp. NBC_01388]|uniref:hypothetical protein n=1 Tax=Nocardia sp. NBC_01388 TaxID=2903596 RepID=UPI002F90B9C5